MSGVAVAALSDRQAPRFDRQKFFPAEWMPIAAEFLSLFHRYSYICKPLSGGSWFSADDSWKLSDTEILKAISCAHPRYIVGCRAGRATRYAVLDIDAGSRYHDLNAIDHLRKTLAAAGITRTMVFRSSFSDGWHLYIFFDEPISSKDLRNQLSNLLKAHDFKIAKGTLEIFPHPSDVSNGQGLRLPLQPGFAWLDQSTLEVEIERSELSATKALELFVDALNSWSNSRHDFHHLKGYVERLAQRKQAAVAHVEKPPANNVVPLLKREAIVGDENGADEIRRIFQVIPPGIKCDVWLKGREHYVSGLTGPSQRAEAIYCLSHYLFYGDPQRSLPALGYGYEQDRKWAIEQILALKHNNQSGDINEGRADAFEQVARAANWVPPHKRGQEHKPYRPDVPIAWIRHNANLKVDARNKIKQSVTEFAANGQAFSVRDLQEKTGCSPSTLYKHQDLWREMQHQLRSLDRFAAVTHEYNAGVGAGSPENQLPAPVVQKDMPPGRLAARRIVYELRMREERAVKEKNDAKDEFNAAYESSWRRQVDESLPQSMERCPTERLKVLVSVYTSLLARSPDEENQVWLLDILSKISTELVRRERAGRFAVLDEMVLDSSDGQFAPAEGAS